MRKYEVLKEYLKSLERVAVAFSGGVDSTLLARAAHDALGDDCLAITAKSCLFPQRELREAIAFCEKEGIRHIIIETNELDIDGFSANPVNRCYLCKTKLIEHIRKIAEQNNMTAIVEGSNMDDNGDYRPGLIAVAEAQVKSPLRHAELTKAEIREISKDFGLPVWNKPSFACLASRLPYGEAITQEKLSKIDKAEQLFIDSGFRQIRVRMHGNLARIETDESGFVLLHDSGLREMIYSKLKEYGFDYTALDLLGYRTGSMNETLSLQQ